MRINIYYNSDDDSTEDVKLNTDAEKFQHPQSKEEIRYNESIINTTLSNEEEKLLKDESNNFSYNEINDLAASDKKPVSHKSKKRRIRILLPNFMLSMFASFAFKFIKDKADKWGISKAQAVKLLRSSIRYIRKSKQHIIIDVKSHEGEGVYIII